jgi:putative phage-type endonuclease
LFVARTSEECEKELQAPQRSQEWLQARKFSITASQFGTAAGLSPYQTPDELINEKLWNTFEGNAATQWGNLHEKHAKEIFCKFFETKYKNFTFIEENLMKFSDEPWMAASPDGIVKYEVDGQTRYDLVEFKCPAYLRNTQRHPYEKHGNIPPHYKAQIQGIMGYLNKHTLMNFQRCWFVVWQPHQTWITEDLFSEDYYKTLHEKLEKWYFTKMLPSFTHQFNGLLIRGTSEPQEEILLN